MKLYDLGVIACSASKLAGGPHRADALYTGYLFRKSLAVCEARCEEVVILSAEHGAIGVYEEIHSYDRRPPTTKADRAEWGRRTSRMLGFFGGHEGRVLVLAPESYFALVRPVYSKAEVVQPLKGLGIGQQKAALKTMARAA